MEIISLDCETEAETFRNLFSKDHYFLAFEENTLVGAMTLVPKSTEHWYWANSGEQIDFQIKFAAGEPNNFHNREFCLGLRKYLDGEVFFYNDITCSNAYLEFKFLCQKIEPISVKKEK